MQLFATSLPVCGPVRYLTIPRSYFIRQCLNNKRENPSRVGKVGNFVF